MVFPADGFGTARSSRSFGNAIVNRLAPANRNIGLDTARGVAIFGMIATHIIPLVTDSGVATSVSIFAGRASALFAVIAGISIVLSTRRTLESGGWGRAAAGLITRGMCIVALGLILGLFTTHVAVILVNYGIMFVIASLFLRAGPRTLGVLAFVWVIVTPFISFAVRNHFQLPQAFEIPNIFMLAEPGYLLTAIGLTGYYPVLQWLGYILIGMSLGHLNWYRTVTCWTAVAVGAGLAVLAKAFSWLLMTASPAGFFALQESALDNYDKMLDELLITGTHGVTPTDTWWWLTVSAPHTGTTLDLAGTAGVALVVIGVCCLVSNALGSFGTTFEQNPTHQLCEGPGRLWLFVLSAPGSMPLTIYSGHVVFLEVTQQFPLGPWPEYALHVYVAVFAAVLWKVFVLPRGPLEQVLSLASSGVARLVPARAVG